MCVRAHPPAALWGRPEWCSTWVQQSRALQHMAVAMRPPVPRSLLLCAPGDVVRARGRVVLIDQLLHNLP